MRDHLDDLDRLPATVYVFRLDAGGQASFPFVSSGCAGTYGFTAEEAMADPALMHDAVHVDDRQQFDDAGQRSLLTLVPMTWEGRVVTSTGQVLEVTVRSRPRRLDDGGTEWLGVVTERPWARAAPDPRSDRRADAVAILGHDVAGPVTAILASAELALESLQHLSGASPGGDASAVVDIEGAQMRRRLRVIMRQARRLADLRNDIVTIAAADGDALDARPEVIDLLPHLRAAADVDAAGVKVVVDCQHDLQCEVQPSHLAQMLTNLLSNAVRYAQSEVQLDARRAGDRVVISVRDDGPGLAPDMANRLFERFAHAGAPRQPGSGTGLGLYIVRTLAHANRGTVDFSRSEGRTQFMIGLPAADEAR